MVLLDPGTDSLASLASVPIVRVSRALCPGVLGSGVRRAPRGPGLEGQVHRHSVWPGPLSCHRASGLSLVLTPTLSPLLLYSFPHQPGASPVPMDLGQVWVLPTPGCGMCRLPPFLWIGLLLGPSAHVKDTRSQSPQGERNPLGFYRNLGGLYVTQNIWGRLLAFSALGTPQTGSFAKPRGPVRASGQQPFRCQPRHSVTLVTLASQEFGSSDSQPLSGTSG